MAQRTPTPPAASAKPRYRVTNWREYNRALVARGAITLWIDEEVLAGWRATGGQGLPYSDAAILCALSLRVVFRLPLRQTQGFLLSLKQLLGLTIEVPHYSTFCRRAATLVVPRLSPPRRRRSAASRHRRHRAEGPRRGRVEGAHAWQGPAPGLAQAAPRRGHHDRRAPRPCPDPQRDPRRRRAGRPARAGRGADRRGLRRQGLRQLRQPPRHPRPRGAAGDPAPQGRRHPPAARGSRTRPPPAAPRSPASPRSAARPGSWRPATTAAPSPRPPCSATRPSSAPA